MSNQYTLEVTLDDGTPYTLYKANPKGIEFHESPITKLLAIGSRGSGKSLILRMDAHMRALTVPGCNLILIRRTYPELLKSHVLFDAYDERQLCGSLDTEMKLLGGYYHSTDHICYYPNGSRLFLSYVGDESDTLKLLSAQFLAAYWDEVTTIPWEFFGKLNASVRTRKGSGLTAVIRAATNPLGPSAREVRDYFVDKSVDLGDDPDYNPEEWGSIQINMEDNPHLDIDQYRRQFSGMPDHIRKAWLEGEFAEEFALFDFKPEKWNVERKERLPYHIIKEVDPKLLHSATIYRAFDMGFFPDPAYCLWIAHLGNRYIAFHEQVWYKTIVKDIAEQIKQKETDLRGTMDSPGPLYGKRVAITFCDPTIDINTGADVRTIKDQFEMLGVPMECSINNREHYASAVHTALAEESYPGTPRLQIYDGGRHAGCPYLIKTIPMMQFNPKHPLALANHKHDHPVVTLAYFLISSASFEQTSVTQTQLRPWQKEKAGTRVVLGQESVRNR